MIGMSILFLALLLVVFAPWISKYSFIDAKIVREDVWPYTKPDSLHYLGTGKFGQDIYTCLLYGVRVRIIESVLVVLISVLIAICFIFLRYLYFPKAGCSNNKLSKYISFGRKSNLLSFFLIISFFYLWIFVGVNIGTYSTLLFVLAIYFSFILVFEFQNYIGNSPFTNQNNHRRKREAILEILAIFISNKNVMSIKLLRCFCQIIMISECFAFLGYSDPSLITLSGSIQLNLPYIVDGMYNVGGFERRIYSLFWPGFALFLLLLGLNSLAIGLEQIKTTTLEK
ncbi:hypothetical protein [Candidatus Lokiarchaeum ossiferum]|uniref:hypothetical protein n=1 Tax=Candidatus Lokiarchaeum ossiferum TaxID=2951803 RepID=UPI00352C7F55